MCTQISILMAPPSNHPLREDELHGFKYFAKIDALLTHLHQHKNHPNRKLSFDRYFSLLLFAYFNPVISSLRGLQQATGLEKVQQKVNVSYHSLGSLSEASQVFDHDLLRHLFLHMAQTVTASDAVARPDGIPKDLWVVAGDASLWKLLPRMARHFYSQDLTRQRKGELKGHFLFDILRGVPVDAHFTDGKVDERHVLPDQLKPNTLYVLDRGYVSWKLFNSIIAAQASVVGRLKGCNTYTVLEDIPLSEAQTKDGIYSDQRVRLGFQKSGPEARLIRCPALAPPIANLHARRRGGKYRAYRPDESILQEWILFTNRLDLPAEDIVKLYHYRWQIETFFRWFKCVLGCRHLFAESENGMRLQFYAALIASLLVVICTGRKPNKRLWEALQFYLMGLCSEKELQKLIERCPYAKHAAGRKNK